MLVPTTILAQQHLGTFRERLARLPATRSRWSRGCASRPRCAPRSPAFADGTLDILIGTHRLLSRDVRAKDLGLVIVDEEQRFGVKQKELLRQLKLQGRRALAVGDADPAHAADEPRRAARHLGDRDAARGPAAGPHLRRPLRRGAGQAGDRARGPRARARSSSSTTGSTRCHDVAERLRGAGPRGRAFAEAHGQMDEGELETTMLALPARRRRLPRRDDDHRVGPRHPAGQHADRRARRPARARPGLPDPRPGRALSRARLRLHALSLRGGRSRARPAPGWRRSPTTPSSARASRSRCATSSCAAPATCSATSSPATSPRSASSSTSRCSTRRSRRCARRARARGRRGARCGSTSTSTPTCRPTTSPSRRRRSTSTAGSPARGAPGELRALRDELRDRFGPLPEPVENLLALQRARIELGARGRPHRRGPRRAALGHAARARRGDRSGACASAIPEAIFELARADALAARPRRPRRSASPRSWRSPRRLSAALTRARAGRRPLCCPPRESAGKKGSPAAPARTGLSAGHKRLALLVLAVFVVGSFVVVAAAQGLGEPERPRRRRRRGRGRARRDDHPGGLRPRARADRRPPGLREVPPEDDPQYERALRGRPSPTCCSRAGSSARPRSAGSRSPSARSTSELETVKEQQFGTEKEFEQFLERLRLHARGGPPADRAPADLRAGSRRRSCRRRRARRSTRRRSRPSTTRTSTQFEQPETRDVRVILTKDEAEANEALAALEDRSFGRRPGRRSRRSSRSTRRPRRPAGCARRSSRASPSRRSTSEIFAAPEGELVGPFETDAGFYVIQVEAITPAQTTPLDDASEQIRQTLIAARQQEIAAELPGRTSRRSGSRAPSAPRTTAIDRCSNAEPPAERRAPRTIADRPSEAGRLRRAGAVDPRRSTPGTAGRLRRARRRGPAAGPAAPPPPAAPPGGLPPGLTPLPGRPPAPRAPRRPAPCRRRAAPPTRRRPAAAPEPR